MSTNEQQAIRILAMAVEILAAESFYQIGGDTLRHVCELTSEALKLVETPELDKTPATDEQILEEFYDLSDPVEHVTYTVPQPDGGTTGYQVRRAVDET